jgi:uncharacterized lipoprotein YmbA
MSLESPTRRRLCLGIALLPTVAGCTSPPARTYTLVPRDPAQPVRSSAVVGVKSVELAKYLDRPQIVRYGDVYELNLAEYERWGENMRDMVMRVLVEDLSLRLPGGQVFADSGVLPLRADTTLDVDISRFDADPDGKVILAARWAVQRQGRRPVLRSDRISVPSNPTDTPALVAAMSDALGQLADRIASALG